MLYITASIVLYQPRCFLGAASGTDPSTQRGEAARLDGSTGGVAAPETPGPGRTGRRCPAGGSQGGLRNTAKTVSLDWISLEKHRKSHGK